MLRAFLERAKHHPHRRFVLLEVNLIAHTLQHVLLRLFLDTRDGKSGRLRAGHNLCCVETGPCALQSASWIRPESAEELCEGIDLKSALIATSAVVSIKCFHGPPGSGKTHQIKRIMSSLHQAFECCLSITEAFSMDDTARKLLRAARTAAGRPLALRVHINVGKFKKSERGQWSALMEKVSKFFFGLLVLRSVSDPLSDIVFNLPPGGTLTVLVEIPDRDSHLEALPDEECLSASARAARDCCMLAEELPVIAALGEMVSPPSLIDVTSDVQLVCKYLRALEDNSIDQLYGSVQSVDLLILMDCTASMKPWISQARAKSIDLVKCAKEKFKVELRVAFVAYRDHAYGARRLDTIDFVAEANMHELVSFISSRCKGFSAEGNDWAEDVAGGLDAALKMSWQNGSSRLVCHFADAPAHGQDYCDGGDSYPSGCPNGLDPKQLMEKLAAQVKANYYFIKCGDSSTTDKMIRVFRAQYQHYPDRDFDTYELGNDATRFLGTMVDTVGRTVSERIETDGGDVVQEECRRLLRKYMRLDAKVLSLMKQTHWLQYLRRRVDILRNSGKFNKNKDFPQFGSTTMTIMLAEVGYENALANCLVTVLICSRVRGCCRWNSFYRRTTKSIGTRLTTSSLSIVRRLSLLMASLLSTTSGVSLQPTQTPRILVGCSAAGYYVHSRCKCPPSATLHGTIGACWTLTLPTASVSNCTSQRSSAAPTARLSIFRSDRFL
jgi:hypothetical protein